MRARAISREEIRVSSAINALGTGSGRGSTGICLYHLDCWTIPREKARKTLGSFLTLHLARHICEDNSEKEICLTSSHTLLTATLSSTLAIPDDSKKGRKRNPRIKETDLFPSHHHLINVPQGKNCYFPWYVTGWKPEASHQVSHKFAEGSKEAWGILMSSHFPVLWGIHEKRASLWALQFFCKWLHALNFGNWT